MSDLEREIKEARITRRLHSKQYDAESINQFQKEVSDIVRKHEAEMDRRAIEEFERDKCKHYSYP